MQTEQPRNSRSGVFRSPNCLTQSALRVPRHEVVETDFRDLEPLISVIREGGQRIVDLLEISIGRSDLAVQFLRRLEGGFHDRRREGMQFGATREQSALSESVSHRRRGGDHDCVRPCHHRHGHDHDAFCALCAL